MISLIRGWIFACVALGIALCPHPSIADQVHQPRYVGVNLAGAEFNARRLPGVLGRDYGYPTKKELDYFLAQGFNVFRLPFLWERLQRKLGGDFNARELKAIDGVVAYATGKGAAVILDPHNYARYGKKEIGTEDVPVSAFAEFWAKLADHYKTNERVFFGLMNEPFKQRADEWRRAADAAIKAIRRTGARNLILVPGTIWSGVHSWQSPRRGISNAEAFKDITDPAGNFAFDLHQYFDGNYSGTSKSCIKGPIVIKAMERMTRWLRRTKHRGFLGEFGVADSQDCLDALEELLAHMKANHDAWLGWTYWAAGARWRDYEFSVHPTADGTVQPQMKILRKYSAVR